MVDRLNYLDSCEHTTCVVTEHHSRPFTDDHGKIWKHSYTAQVESSREGGSFREFGVNDLATVPIGLREGFYAQDIVYDGMVLHDDFWSVWGPISIVLALGVLTLLLPLLGFMSKPKQVTSHQHPS